MHAITSFDAVFKPSLVAIESGVQKKRKYWGEIVKENLGIADLSAANPASEEETDFRVSGGVISVSSYDPIRSFEAMIRQKPSSLDVAAVQMWKIVSDKLTHAVSESAFAVICGIVEVLRQACVNAQNANSYNQSLVTLSPTWSFFLKIELFNI